MGPVPGLCLLAKRRERRFPEAGQSIAKPRSADYPKIATGGICEAIATPSLLSLLGGLEFWRLGENLKKAPKLHVSLSPSSESNPCQFAI